MTDAVLIDRPREGVAVVTLNRPAVHNAIDVALFRALFELVVALEADDAIGCIVLTGAGERAFSAGYDIKELTGFTPDEQIFDYWRRDQWMWKIASCRKPVIAALNGLAYGGGAALAIGCDMRVGSANSPFRLTAASYNGANCTWSLPAIVGHGIAKEWLMTGRLVTPEEALAHGLLNHLVAPDAVLAKAMELAGLIADNPPGGPQAVKLMVDEGIGRRRVDAFRAETHHLLNEQPPAPAADLFTKFLNDRA